MYFLKGWLDIMNYKNELLIIFIILFILLLNFSTGYCQDEELGSRIKEFAVGIYSNYADHNFEYVYNVLHPAIKDILVAEDYIEFQEQNFKKYNLKLSDIVVNEKIENCDIPQEFQEYINKNVGGKVKIINVSYHMKFLNNGQKIGRDINKEVFIYLDKKQNLYLLWDPQIIK